MDLGTSMHVHVNASLKYMYIYKCIAQIKNGYYGITEPFTEGDSSIQFFVSHTNLFTI